MPVNFGAPKFRISKGKGCTPWVPPPMQNSVRKRYRRPLQP